MRKVFIFLCLLLVPVLSGCGNQAENYQKYVKSNLDVIYRNDITTYKKVMDVKEEDAKAYHQQAIDNFLNDLIEQLDLSVTEEQKKELAAVVEQVYAQAKYEVKPAKKKDGDYYVEVNVYPMDYRVNVAADCEVLLSVAALEVEQENGTYETEEEFKKRYTEEAIKIIKQHAEKISYGEVEEFSLQIHFDKDKFYIENEDFLEVTDYIFMVVK